MDIPAELSPIEWPVLAIVLPKKHAELLWEDDCRASNRHRAAGARRCATETVTLKERHDVEGSAFHLAVRLVRSGHSLFCVVSALMWVGTLGGKYNLHL